MYLLNYRVQTCSIITIGICPRSQIFCLNLCSDLTPIRPWTPLTPCHRQDQVDKPWAWANWLGLSVFTVYKQAELTSKEVRNIHPWRVLRFLQAARGYWWQWKMEFSKLGMSENWPLKPEQFSLTKSGLLLQFIANLLLSFSAHSGLGLCHVLLIT